MSASTTSIYTLSLHDALPIFSFALAELTPGTTKTFLDGRATVTAEVGALRLTGPKTEDDYPALARGRDGTVRSEEHTSELQSHSDLVCRLLLEKKKTGSVAAS